MAHPESRFTHPICSPCYYDKRPDHEPVRLKEAVRVPEFCCTCGHRTIGGIYLRADPADLEHCPMKKMT